MSEADDSVRQLREIVENYRELEYMADEVAVMAKAADELERIAKLAALVEKLAHRLERHLREKNDTVYVTHVLVEMEPLRVLCAKGGQQQ